MNPIANTIEYYSIYFGKWMKYRGMTTEELIQEKFQDSQKPPYEQGVVEERLRGFNKWLRENGIAPRSAMVALQRSPLSTGTSTCRWS